MDAPETARLFFFPGEEFGRPLRTTASHYGACYAAGSAPARGIKSCWLNHSGIDRCLCRQVSNAQALPPALLIVACQGPRGEAPGTLLRLRVAPLAASRLHPFYKFVTKAGLLQVGMRFSVVCTSTTSTKTEVM